MLFLCLSSVGYFQFWIPKSPVIYSCTFNIVKAFGPLLCVFVWLAFGSCFACSTSIFCASALPGLFCSPTFIRPLFGGSHCLGYSSGQGSGCCLPVWVWRIVQPPVNKFLRILCCFISDSCYPKLVVFVASKFNGSLVRIHTSSPPWPLSPRLLLLSCCGRTPSTLFLTPTRTSSPPSPLNARFPTKPKSTRRSAWISSPA